MRVYLAGGIHDDPLCRRRLVEWLKDLLAKESKPPRLIAVEHDPNVKGFVTMERSAFKNLASGLWGDGVDPGVAEMLAQSLAWEVDAHRAVIDEDPFFLDDPGSREKAMKGSSHLTLMKARLTGYEGAHDDVEAIANHVDAAAVAAASIEALAEFRKPENREKQAKREEGWLARVRYEVRFDLVRKQDGWILGVVGALHASQHDDRTFRNLLANTAGFDIVDVRYLAWIPKDIA